MEFGLKYLRKLVDEFSTNNNNNNSSYLVDYDHLCRHSSRLIPDKKLVIIRISLFKKKKQQQ